MDAIKSLLTSSSAGPYGYGGSSGLVDGVKWVVLGGTVETARRLGTGAWNHFINSFFLTAHFNEDEAPYDWLMLWLSRRPEWQRSREFETTTRITTPGGFKAGGIGEFGDEDADDNTDGDNAKDDDVAHPKTRVVFQPTFDTTHTIYFRGHWLRVKRTRRTDRYGYSDGETLSISVVARNNSILKQLVLRAKREYEAEAIHRIQIYFADQYGGWRWTDSRHKRPLSSIVLNPGVKEMLLNDAKDFLASEKWYADRGIPFRRGYLLHGVPGSGKSSLIHALAGELMLDIYVVSLSSSWISDATLTTLMGRVPARCILLLEDLDAAFTRSLNREKKEKRARKKAKKEAKKNKDKNNGDGNGGEGPSPPPRRRNRHGESLSDQNTLSLSGLLNALDGVAASEGRILFATTNHLTKLDPALSRPGRMDVWIEFKNASRWQAEALFRNFFPVDESASTPVGEQDEKELKDAGVFIPEEGERIGDSLSADGSSSSDTAVSPPASPKGKERQQASTNDSQSSLFSRLSTPVSVFSDLMSGGSSGNPTQSVSQSEVKPPALVYTASQPPSSPSSTAPMFSPSSSRRSSGIDLSALPQFGSENEAHMPPPIAPEILDGRHSAKPTDRETLGKYAKAFADSIPEGEFSVASLQGYLLKHKSKPLSAADNAAAWVVGEREMKAKLEKKKKDREERKKKRKAKAKEKAKLAKQKKEEEAKKKAAEAAAAASQAQPLPPAPASGSPTPPPPMGEDSIIIVPPLPPSPPLPAVAVDAPLPPLPVISSPPPVVIQTLPPLPPQPVLVAEEDPSDSESDSDEDSDDEDDEDDSGSSDSDSDSSSDEDK